MIHIFHADAEFVFGQSGGDVGMRMRAYVGIDAESDIGCLAFRSGQLIDDFQLRNGFYVEAEDIIIQSEVYLPVCFAYTCKHYLIGREAGLMAARISPPLTQSLPTRFHG